MANQGLAPIVPGTNVGTFRLLLGDTDPDNVLDGKGTYRYYSDDEVESLVTLFGGSVKRAAAQALRTIAASQALLLKSFSADDLSVRGDQIAEALRKLALDLDNAAMVEESNVDGEVFNIIPFDFYGEPEFAPARFRRLEW